MPAPKMLRISQVAELLNVSASSLRNWERQGLIAPERSESRYRLYSPEAVRQLKRVDFLRRIKRVNPSGIAHIRSEDAELRPVAAEAEIPISARLVALRVARGLSRSEAAKLASVRADTIKSIEDGLTRPSVATLQKLARIYRTNVLSLYQKDHDPRRLVRPQDRGVLSESGVRMELLAFGVRQMEPHLFRIAPRATSGGTYQHEGEEFIYMLSGKFEIWLNELEHYVLHAGDSLYFPSDLPHRWRALGDAGALLLWINTPCTF
jgi:DNA-binding transcriptional MerR regulator/quercetin dioxygenase-like cupin family protein